MTKDDFDRLQDLACRGSALMEMLEEVQAGGRSTLSIGVHEQNVRSQDHTTSLTDILKFEIGSVEIDIEDLVSKKNS